MKYLAPILVIMTFLSIFLVIPNFLFYLYLIKSKKEKALWKNIKVYLEDNEEISIQAKIDQDILYLKTWKIISIRKEDIEEIIREDKIKMIFHFDKEYYILFNAIDFDALNFWR